MTNGQRAMEIIKKYGFDFSHIPKQEIIDLIEKEIVSYRTGILRREHVFTCAVSFKDCPHFPRKILSAMWREAHRLPV